MPQPDVNVPETEMRPWQRMVLFLMKTAAIYLVLMVIMLLLQH